MSHASRSRALFASGLCLWALSALAQTNGSTTTTTTTTGTTAGTDTSQSSTTPTTISQETWRLVRTYTPLAGSTANAQALVTGLQSGSSITLTTAPTGTGGTTSTTGTGGTTGTTSTTGTSTTFTPATGKMGLGEVNISLALAKAELSKLGITQPTPAQLQAALNGGTLTAADGSSVKFTGVLAQRQAGMGWGAIAKSMGVRLGALVSASKTGHAGAKASKADTGAKHGGTNDDGSLAGGNAAGKGAEHGGKGSEHGGSNGGSGGATEEATAVVAEVARSEPCHGGSWLACRPATSVFLMEYTT